MKLIDNRTPDKIVKFDDLPVGEAYLDQDDAICVKTSNEYDGDNCMYYMADCEAWEAGRENHNLEVRPIKITYTVEG